jgi:hypothetical protein
MTRVKDSLNRDPMKDQVDKSMGMKDQVDKSMGIVTIITEDLTKIRPTETSKLGKQSDRRKRNKSDSSDNSPATALVSRCVYKNNKRRLFKKSSYK